MDTTSLKEYIFNNNKVEFVLEKIGCKSIKYHSSKNFYSAANYNGDNTGAVNVYNTKHLLIITGLVRMSLMMYQILFLLLNTIKSVHL